MLTTYLKNLDRFKVDLDGAITLAPEIIAKYFPDCPMNRTATGMVTNLLAREEQWSQFLLDIGQDREMAEFLMFAVAVRQK